MELSLKKNSFENIPENAVHIKWSNLDVMFVLPKYNGDKVCCKYISVS